MRTVLLSLSLGSLLALAACEQVPLLAPTGSTITLTSSSNAISANGSTTIVAQVIEAAGTPPHSGTHVTFTTSLGQIQPSEVETDRNGQAIATFSANGVNGMATIAALSGGAKTAADGALKIAVGSAAVGAVALGANPSSVSANGGSTTVTARVIDVNGNSLVGSPVTFTTTAGSLGSNLVTTDGNGVASTTLTTSLQAVVTATVGVAAAGGTGTTTPTGTNTASVTITVTNGPTVSIAAPAVVTKGTAASFTITTAVGATNGAPIRNVNINWGDGNSADLGAIAASSIQSHTYTRDGAVTVTAMVVDYAGASSSSSALVDVQPAQAPTIIINPPATVTAGVSATFTVITTASTTSAPRTVNINWGDRSESFTVATGTITRTHTYPASLVTKDYPVSATVTDNATGAQGSTDFTVTVTPP